MYLKSALALAIPYAILDREDMERAFDYEGEDAKAASEAVIYLQGLRGLSPANFTSEQREQARMALLWGEQYLSGLIDALGESDKAELVLALKHRRQIRSVRIRDYGNTLGEREIANSIEVPIGSRKDMEALINMLSLVACPCCGTRTNMRAVGDVCNWCKQGVFAETSPQ